MITVNDRVNQYAPILTRKGIEEKNKGHALKALKYFNGALYHDPHYAYGIFQLISVEPDELKRRNLIHRLAISNVKNSDFNPVIFSLGMFYFQKEEYETANYYFIKAIYNYPFYPMPIFYSAISFFKQGQLEGTSNLHNSLIKIPGVFNPVLWSNRLKNETKDTYNPDNPTFSQFAIQEH